MSYSPSTGNSSSDERVWPTGMLNSNHPDDERLAALAEGDTDASADATLRGHVSSCDRCTTLVGDLGVLRSALAELPDVPPHRPLRLLPPVEAEAPGAADRLNGWVRRLFAPALTAGAALAMVGLVGTAMPQGMGGAGGAATAPEESVREFTAAASDRTAAEQGAAGGAEASTELEAAPPSAGVTDLSDGGGEVTAQGNEATAEERLAEDDGADAQINAFEAERSPWPMVLFTGVALMIAAALLRWILAPRAV